MIDTWLFAAVCLFMLAFCAALRTIPGPTRLDRLVAINTAVTIAGAGLVCLTIATGNVLVMYGTILFVIACFSGTIVVTRHDMEVA